VDIGSHSIKIVELKESKKGVELIRFGVATLPSDTVVEGTLANFPLVVDTLRALVKKNKFKQKKCALSVSGNSVIVKKISLPQMTEEELQESVQWEAEQYIPFDIKDVNVDVQILSPEDGQGQMDVLLVAAKKEVINDYVAVVMEAGLEPRVMDASTFTLQNCHELNYGKPNNEIIALVNVGASCMNLNVVAGDTTAFTRDIMTGARTITAEIQKRFNLPWDEAEHYKVTLIDDLDNRNLAREVKRLITRVSDGLATEIQRSLDFFAATTAHMNISKLFLAGGGAMCPEFVTVVSDRLGVPIEVLHPFQNITINPKHIDLDLLRAHATVPAVAVGLALRKTKEKK
jgi:type IV pilus assembly protein PilM